MQISDKDGEGVNLCVKLMKTLCKYLTKNSVVQTSIHIDLPQVGILGGRSFGKGMYNRICNK